jgi:hypothetical protein
MQSSNLIAINDANMCTVNAARCCLFRLERNLWSCPHWLQIFMCWGKGTDSARFLAAACMSHRGSCALLCSVRQSTRGTASESGVHGQIFSICVLYCQPFASAVLLTGCWKRCAGPHRGPVRAVQQCLAAHVSLNTNELRESTDSLHKPAALSSSDMDDTPAHGDKGKDESDIDEDWGEM